MEPLQKAFWAWAVEADVQKQHHDSRYFFTEVKINHNLSTIVDAFVQAKIMQSWGAGTSMDEVKATVNCYSNCFLFLLL